MPESLAMEPVSTMPIDRNDKLILEVRQHGGCVRTD
jgi:hypothetical protein